MSDTVFSFGKHRGKTFQQVFDLDRSYVSWVTKLDGTSGQMRLFCDYCQERNAAHGGGGGVAQLGTQQLPLALASAPLQIAAPAAEQQPSGVGLRNVPVMTFPDCKLCVELCGHGMFRIVPGDAKFLPLPVWQELAKLPEGRRSADNKEFLFSFSAFEAIMQQIRRSPILSSCQLDEVPGWVIEALDRAKQERAATQDEAERSLQEYLAAIPPTLLEERPIMQFQKEGIRFGIARSGRCLLGDEMGLGKTLQALAIAAHYGSEWPVLVVAPSALRLVWRDQALQWLPHHLAPHEIQVVSKCKQKVDTSARMVITSYDLLVRAEDHRMRADGKNYEVVIIDECHYIKNFTSRRTEVVLKIARAATRCIMISGTPAANRAEELFTQVQALLHEYVPRSKARFCERYCEKKQMFIPGRGNIQKWDGARNKMELYTLLTGTIMIRRLKNDVLTQLPSKRRQRIALSASKLNVEKMREVARLMGRGKKNEFAELEVDFELKEEGQLDARITECFSLTAQAKVEAVAEYVEYLLGNDLKFLFFGHHMAMLDGIEKKVGELGVKFMRIDGRTSAERRQANVVQFQQDEATRVAILSITACGQGLTLTAAHTVIFGELYWVPGQMMQAEDRVHRIGQQNMVDVHYCVAEGTVDDILFHSLNRKRKDTSEVMDGVAKHMDAYRQSDAPSLPSETAGGGDATDAPGEDGLAPASSGSSPVQPPSGSPRKRLRKPGSPAVALASGGVTAVSSPPADSCVTGLSRFFKPRAN
eukprot:TRINITY_DN26962_c0_g1_i1.p1 TRINITY_DN26962_c0_g1~~TRINITY_DN26962_c0_g1_i1.p1  ORF type:complete len:792 (+),score=159.47 TRINITY_DN26962_c0_g1_i1:98-2377(+)